MVRQIKDHLNPQI